MKLYCIAGVKIGPGGYYCPCCNPFGVNTRKLKRYSHRILRRFLKRKLREEEETAR
jgi:hypothetical protein